MTTRPAVPAKSIQETSAKEAGQQQSWNVRAGMAIVTGLAIGSVIGAAIASPLTARSTQREIICTSMVVSIANPSQPFAGLRCS